MLQRYICALADLSVNVKTYQHDIFGVVASDTPVPSDCAKKCQQAAFSLHQGRSYPALELCDSNKGWEKEWFVVSNPAPCLPARTGRALEPRTCWEEQPTEEEMVQVDLLLKKIAGLLAQGLMGAVVAPSFNK